MLKKILIIVIAYVFISGCDYEEKVVSEPAVEKSNKIVPRPAPDPYPTY